MEAFENLDSWKADIFANYSGSDRKDGLISPDGKRHLVKYAEKHQKRNNLDTSYVNNVIAEYLSSHILSIIGYNVHNTFIATRNNDLLVACENFTSSDKQLIEFGVFMRKHYDSKDVGRVPDWKQIQYVLSHDEILSPYFESFLQSYADRFIGDAFIGNFDRHMGNFGYLVSQDGTVIPSPIYDNGSTLFPALSEKAMEKDILPSEYEIVKRTLLFLKAALMVNGQKVSYYDMLASGYDEHMTAAVTRMVSVIQFRMPEIFEFIEGCSFLSDIRKNFYKKILSARMRYILEPAYKRCVEKQYDKEALERIQNGIPYTEAMFKYDFENRRSL